MLFTTRLIVGLYALLASQLKSVCALPTSTRDLVARDSALGTRSPGGENDSDHPLHSRAAKPFYAIAHRVLTVQGVKDALSHGASAIEIDFTPWSKTGWWADHDGTQDSAGGTARDVLQAVADQRRAGKPRDFCLVRHQWVHCSVTALRDLAREILQPVGVRALYGFYGTQYKYTANSRIANNFNSNEAVNLDGSLSWAQKGFDGAGPGDRSRRVYSCGDPTIRNGFNDRVADLTAAASSGQFAKVFS